MPIVLPADHDKDAWQVAVWNAPDDELSRPQKLELMHMLEAGFNSFDPFPVVRDLLARRDLWDGAVMCRGFPFEADGKTLPGWHLYSDLIALRDVADGIWNVDTLYLLHDRSDSDALTRLAGGWSADEVALVEDAAVGRLLGVYNAASTDAILRVWWD